MSTAAPSFMDLMKGARQQPIPNETHGDAVHHKSVDNTPSTNLGAPTHSTLSAPVPDHQQKGDDHEADCGTPRSVLTAASTAFVDDSVLHMVLAFVGSADLLLAVKFVNKRLHDIAFSELEGRLISKKLAIPRWGIGDDGSTPLDGTTATYTTTGNKGGIIVPTTATSSAKQGAGGSSSSHYLHHNSHGSAVLSDAMSDLDGSTAETPTFAGSGGFQGRNARGALSRSVSSLVGRRAQRTVRPQDMPPAPVGDVFILADCAIARFDAETVGDVRLDTQKGASISGKDTSKGGMLPSYFIVDVSAVEPGYMATGILVGSVCAKILPHTPDATVRITPPQSKGGVSQHHHATLNLLPRHDVCTLGTYQGLQLSTSSGGGRNDRGLFKGWSAVGGGDGTSGKKPNPNIPSRTTVALTHEQQQVYLKRRLQEEVARNISRAALSKSAAGGNAAIPKASTTPSTTSSYATLSQDQLRLIAGELEELTSGSDNLAAGLSSKTNISKNKTSTGSSSRYQATKIKGVFYIGPNRYKNFKAPPTSTSTTSGAGAADSTTRVDGRFSLDQVFTMMGLIPYLVSGTALFEDSACESFTTGAVVGDVGLSTGTAISVVDTMRAAFLAPSFHSKVLPRHRTHVEMSISNPIITSRRETTVKLYECPLIGGGIGDVKASYRVSEEASLQFDQCTHISMLIAQGTSSSPPTPSTIFTTSPSSSVHTSTDLTSCPSTAFHYSHFDVSETLSPWMVGCASDRVASKGITASPYISVYCHPSLSPAHNHRHRNNHHISPCSAAYVVSSGTLCTRAQVALEDVLTDSAILARLSSLHPWVLEESSTPTISSNAARLALQENCPFLDIPPSGPKGEDSTTTAPIPLHSLGSGDGCVRLAVFVDGFSAPVCWLPPVPLNTPIRHLRSLLLRLTTTTSCTWFPIRDNYQFMLHSPKALTALSHYITALSNAIPVGSLQFKLQEMGDSQQQRQRVGSLGVGSSSGGGGGGAMYRSMSQKSGGSASTAVGKKVTVTPTTKGDRVSVTSRTGASGQGGAMSTGHMSLSPTPLPRFIEDSTNGLIPSSSSITTASNPQVTRVASRSIGGGVTSSSSQPSRGLGMKPVVSSAALDEVGGDATPTNSPTPTTVDLSPISARHTPTTTNNEGLGGAYQVTVMDLLPSLRTGTFQLRAGGRISGQPAALSRGVCGARWGQGVSAFEDRVLAIVVSPTAFVTSNANNNSVNLIGGPWSNTTTLHANASSAITMPPLEGTQQNGRVRSTSVLPDGSLSSSGAPPINTTSVEQGGAGTSPLMATFIGNEAAPDSPSGQNAKRSGKNKSSMRGSPSSAMSRSTNAAQQQGAASAVLEDYLSIHSRAHEACKHGDTNKLSELLFTPSQIMDANSETQHQQTSSIRSPNTLSSASFSQPRVLLSVNDRGPTGSTLLHTAAEHGRVGVIQLLLSLGASPCLINGAGRLPIHLAAEKGHAECCPLLLAGPTSSSSRGTSSCPAYLHYVQTLLTTSQTFHTMSISACALGVQDDTGRTALHLCLESRLINTSLWLVEQGADVRGLMDDQGFSCADLAMQHLPSMSSLCASGAVEEASLTLFAGMMDVSAYVTMLRSEQRNSPDEVIEKQLGPFYVEVLKHKLTDGRMLLDLYGDKCIAKATGAVIPSTTHNTALHETVLASIHQTGQIEVLRRLVMHPMLCQYVDLFAENVSGDTVLHVACRQASSSLSGCAGEVDNHGDEIESNTPSNEIIELLLRAIAERAVTRRGGIASQKHTKNTNHDDTRDILLIRQRKSKYERKAASGPLCYPWDLSEEEDGDVNADADSALRIALQDLSDALTWRNCAGHTPLHILGISGNRAAMQRILHWVLGCEFAVALGISASPSLQQSAIHFGQQLLTAFVDADGFSVLHHVVSMMGRFDSHSSSSAPNSLPSAATDSFPNNTIAKTSNVVSRFVMELVILSIPLSSADNNTSSTGITTIPYLPVTPLQTRSKHLTGMKKHLSNNKNSNEDAPTTHAVPTILSSLLLATSDSSEAVACGTLEWFLTSMHQTLSGALHRGVKASRLDVVWPRAYFGLPSDTSIPRLLCQTSIRHAATKWNILSDFAAIHVGDGSPALPSLYRLAVTPAFLLESVPRLTFDHRDAAAARHLIDAILRTTPDSLWVDSLIDASPISTRKSTEQDNLLVQLCDRHERLMRHIQSLPSTSFPAAPLTHPKQSVVMSTATFKQIPGAKYPSLSNPSATRRLKDILAPGPSPSSPMSSSGGSPTASPVRHAAVTLESIKEELERPLLLEVEMVEYLLTCILEVVSTYGTHNPAPPIPTLVTPKNSGIITPPSTTSSVYNVIMEAAVRFLPCVDIGDVLSHWQRAADPASDYPFTRYAPLKAAAAALRASAGDAEPTYASLHPINGLWATLLAALHTISARLFHSDQPSLAPWTSQCTALFLSRVVLGGSSYIPSSTNATQSRGGEDESNNVPPVVSNAVFNASRAETIMLRFKELLVVTDFGASISPPTAAATLLQLLCSPALKWWDGALSLVRHTSSHAYRCLSESCGVSTLLTQSPSDFAHALATSIPLHVWQTPKCIGSMLRAYAAELSPLHSAAYYGQSSLVQALLSTGQFEVDTMSADCFATLQSLFQHLNAVVEETSNLADSLVSTYKTTLSFAFEKCDVMKFACEPESAPRHPYAFSQLRHHRWTPLHLAVRQGHAETVSLLLAFGANVEATTLLGSHLHGPLQGTSTLLNKQPRMNVFHLASFGSSLPVFNTLVSHPSVAEHHLRSRDHLPIHPHFAALYPAHATLVNSSYEGPGMTPLHYAAIVGNLPVLERMVAFFPSLLSDLDPEGNSSIILAARYGRGECVLALATAEQRGSTSSDEALLIAVNPLTGLTIGHCCGWWAGNASMKHVLVRLNQQLEIQRSAQSVFGRGVGGGDLSQKQLRRKSLSSLSYLNGKGVGGFHHDTPIAAVGRQFFPASQNVSPTKSATAFQQQQNATTPPPWDVLSFVISSTAVSTTTPTSPDVSTHPKPTSFEDAASILKILGIDSNAIMTEGDQESAPELAELLRTAAMPISSRPGDGTAVLDSDDVDPAGGKRLLPLMLLQRYVDAVEDGSQLAKERFVKMVSYLSGTAAQELELYEMLSASSSSHPITTTTSSSLRGQDRVAASRLRRGLGALLSSVGSFVSFEVCGSFGLFEEQLLLADAVVHSTDGDAALEGDKDEDSGDREASAAAARLKKLKVLSERVAHLIGHDPSNMGDEAISLYGSRPGSPLTVDREGAASHTIGHNAAASHILVSGDALVFKTELWNLYSALHEAGPQLLPTSMPDTSLENTPPTDVNGNGDEAPLVPPCTAPFNAFINLFTSFKAALTLQNDSNTSSIVAKLRELTSEEVSVLSAPYVSSVFSGVPLVNPSTNYWAQPHCPMYVDVAPQAGGDTANRPASRGSTTIRADSISTSTTKPQTPLSSGGLKASLSVAFDDGSSSEGDDDDVLANTTASVHPAPDAVGGGGSIRPGSQRKVPSRGGSRGGRRHSSSLPIVPYLSTRALAVHYARANGNIFALRSGDVGSASGKSRCGGEDDAVCALSATIKVCYSSVAIEAEKAAARLAEEEARRAIFFPVVVPPTDANINTSAATSVAAGFDTILNSMDGILDTLELEAETNVYPPNPPPPPPPRAYHSHYYGITSTGLKKGLLGVLSAPGAGKSRRVVTKSTSSTFRNLVALTPPNSTNTPTNTKPANISHNEYLEDFLASWSAKSVAWFAVRADGFLGTVYSPPSSPITAFYSSTTPASTVTKTELDAPLELFASKCAMQMHLDAPLHVFPSMSTGGPSLLLLVAYYGQLHALELLLDAGADTNTIYKLRPSTTSTLTSTGSVAPSPTASSMMPLKALLNPKTNTVTTITTSGSGGAEEGKSIVSSQIRQRAMIVRRRKSSMIGASTMSGGGVSDAPSGAISGGTPSSEMCGITALMASVLGGHYTCAKRLLESGADPDISDECGNTSLHFAVHTGNFEMVKLLLRFGSSMDVENHSGHVAQDVAVALRKSSIMRVLTWWRLASKADSTGTEHPPADLCTTEVEFAAWLADAAVFYKRLDALHNDYISFRNTDAENSVSVICYRRICKRLGSPVMKALVQELAASRFPDEVDSLRLDGVFFESDTLASLLATLKILPKLEFLSLSRCSLTNPQVSDLCSALYEHPGIRRIDLTYNKNLTKAAALRLEWVLKHNRRVVILDTTNTGIEQYTQQHLSWLGDENKRALAAAFNSYSYGTLVPSKKTVHPPRGMIEAELPSDDDLIVLEPPQDGGNNQHHRPLTAEPTTTTTSEANKISESEEVTRVSPKRVGKKAKSFFPVEDLFPTSPAKGISQVSREREALSKKLERERQRQERRSVLAEEYARDGAAPPILSDVGSESASEAGKGGGSAPFRHHSTSSTSVPRRRSTQLPLVASRGTSVNYSQLAKATPNSAPHASKAATAPSLRLPPLDESNAQRLKGYHTKT